MNRQELSPNRHAFLRLRGSSPRALSGFALALLLAGCGASEPEVVPGQKVAHAEGMLLESALFSGSASSTRAVAVWTYWPEDQCEYANDEYDSVSCSGAYLPTEATLLSEDGRFVLDVVEPPPDFVHGFDVATAEAFIAIVPSDADLATVDFTDPAQTIGVVSDFVIVYAPTDFAENTVEAASVGSPIGSGFHLVKVLSEDGQYYGEQYNVVLENGDEVISIQTGELVAEATTLLVQPGDVAIPGLAL